MQDNVGILMYEMGLLEHVAKLSCYFVLRAEVEQVSNFHLDSFPAIFTYIVQLL